LRKSEFEEEKDFFNQFPSLLFVVAASSTTSLTTPLDRHTPFTECPKPQPTVFVFGFA